MDDRELTALLAGRRRAPAAGFEPWSLRVLTAAEVLSARREAAELAGEDRERALCANACLLARAVEKDGKAVFGSGQAVLERLTVEEIAGLAGQWAAFSWAENPGAQDGEERVERLKKAWSTRLMSALNGACCAVLALFPPRGRRGR